MILNIRQKVEVANMIGECVELYEVGRNLYIHKINSKEYTHRENTQAKKDLTRLLVNRGVLDEDGQVVLNLYDLRKGE